MKKVNVDPSRCPQDHHCPLLSQCPVGAISQEGFCAPKIDHELCVVCGKCVAICPHKVMSLE